MLERIGKLIPINYNKASAMLVNILITLKCLIKFNKIPVVNFNKF